MAEARQYSTTGYVIEGRRYDKAEWSKLGSSQDEKQARLDYGAFRASGARMRIRLVRRTAVVTDEILEQDATG